MGDSAGHSIPVTLLFPTMAKKLTDISIAKLKANPNKRLEIPDAGKPGLYLLVQPNGKKSWAVRYRRPSDGRPTKLTLTGFPSLSLAHKLAQEALDLVASGGDPASAKRVSREARSSDLFKDVAAQFLERHVKPNSKPSYAYETERMLNKEVLPLWGNRRIQDISKRDVLDLLDGIVDRGGGFTANRVLATIRKLFNWAITRAIIVSSPVSGIKPPLAENERDRILADAEILRFWQASGEVGYPFGDMARLLLLTGQRRTEVSGMTWAELNLADGEWLIPGERTKNGEPHSVPLSNAALDIIKSLTRIKSDKGYVFTTTGDTHVTGYSRAKASIDSAMGEAPRWTFHDLRRTAATGMARLGIALPVIEKVLNHTSGSFAGIVGVYQRHSFADEKRSALETWARFVLSLQHPAKNVSRIRVRQ
jgi:integrase